MKIIKKGHVRINNCDIACFSCWNVGKDIIGAAYKLIEVALTRQVAISRKELEDSLEAVGLSEEIKYLSIYQRASE